jgi:hypothetical protein
MLGEAMKERKDIQSEFQDYRYANIKITGLQDHKITQDRFMKYEN